jgi:HlyD family secretion protein
MVTSRTAGLVVLGLALAAIGSGGYWMWHAKSTPSLIGVVHSTEIRVAPEIGGRLVQVQVHKGDSVHKGDILAELSALELTASVEQARAALVKATADRNNVYAGKREEQRASLASEIVKAKSRLQYAQQQLARATYLASTDTASQQTLDQAQKDVASAQADLAEAQANSDAAVAGPTQEERAIADAQVEATTAALHVLERRLDKTLLRAPTDGTVSVIVAEVGENVRAGQPVLVLDAGDRQWLSFDVREDLLRGLTVGDKVDVTRPEGKQPSQAQVTELVPLGSFATWQAERAVGDHDRNTLRLRLDPQQAGFVPGMTVLIRR